MTVTVLTETSAYLLDYDTMTATRLPGRGAGDDPSETRPALLLNLRRDAEPLPLLQRPDLIVGQPLVMLLQVREDGIPTWRTTTNIREIRS